MLCRVKGGGDTFQRPPCRHTGRPDLGGRAVAEQNVIAGVHSDGLRVELDGFVMVPSAEGGIALGLRVRGGGIWDGSMIRYSEGPDRVMGNGDILCAARSVPQSLGLTLSSSADMPK